MTDLTEAHTERLRRALEDTRQQLTNHINRTINELQNALTNIAVTRAPLENQLAEIALAELVADVDRDEFPVRPDMIIETVAIFYGYTTQELLSASRTKTLTQARQAAMWLSRQLTDLSLPAIGRAFDRDHTTVMHAARSVQNMVDTDPLTARLLTDITKVIKRQAAMNALRGARMNPPRRTA
jgi:chromosomal replication initiator protein